MDDKCPHCSAPSEQIEVTLNPVTGRTEYHCFCCGFWWCDESDKPAGGD
jgi:transposase-like protein